MTEDMPGYEDLLNRIIALELDMFERVRSSEPSLCQEKPEAFKAMRWMTHSVLSADTLASYLEDLNTALKQHRNLMTLKYARMEGKLAPLKDNPLIDEIVRIEEEWMQELARKYPHTIKGGSGFKAYLTSELETYSDKTLELYYRDVSDARKEGRNLAEERYTNLFRKIGYSSIAEAEEKAKRDQGG